jgi:hypothetical protein
MVRPESKLTNAARLTLTLFMARIITNYAHHTFAAHNLAFTAHFLD